MNSFKKSTAETIADRFENGQNFEDADGVELEILLRNLSTVRGLPATRPALELSGFSRWEFADGSAIIEGGSGAWDVGFPGEGLQCVCWPEAFDGNHAETCEEA